MAKMEYTFVIDNTDLVTCLPELVDLICGALCPDPHLHGGCKILAAKCRHATTAGA